MKRIFSFLSRRWFRILAGVFFVFLLIAYLGFKYCLTESFVRARVLPMLTRSMRHDIEVDSVRGGFVSGFVAKGIRIKDPVNLGIGDHIIAQEVRIRPDWFALLRRKFVIRSIECRGVEVLFRKTPDGRGNWMPDARYPQLRGKPQADPVLVRTLDVSDFEYRFEDEGSGFETVMSVEHFAGSLTSDENVVITVRGIWQTDSLVYGRPLRRQHIPGFACEGVLASDTRGKRTDIQVRAFKGDQQLTARGVYNWQEGKSFVEFQLENGVADLGGEYFRSLFPGLVPLGGDCEYSGTIYKGGGETRIQIDAFSSEGRVDHDGIRDFPVSQVRHRTRFDESEHSSQLVWSATGSISTCSDEVGCTLPFETELAYSPHEDRLMLREFEVTSPDVVFDASGFIWFPEARAANLGLEGRGTATLDSNTLRAFFSGMPLDASMAFAVGLQGSTESPLLTVASTAPRLRLTPPGSRDSINLAHFSSSQTVDWTGKGQIRFNGSFASDSVVWETPEGISREFPALTADHEILRDFNRNGWELTALTVHFPKSQIRLPYPVWLSPVPKVVHIHGQGEIEEIVKALDLRLPVEVDGHASFEARWAEVDGGREISVVSESPLVRLATGPSEPVCVLEGARLSTRLNPAFANKMSASFELSASRIGLNLIRPEGLTLGESQLAAGIDFASGHPLPDSWDLALSSAGWLIQVRPYGVQPKICSITAEGNLERLLGILGITQDFNATGSISLAGTFSTGADEISFDGGWNGDSVEITLPGSGSTVGLRHASGFHRCTYRPLEDLTIHSRVEAGDSLLRSGTRETLLGKAETGAAVQWHMDSGRVDLHRAWFENQKMRFNLGGEIVTDEAAPTAHLQFEVEGPLELLWSLAQSQSATESVSPGTGDLRLKGEFWRERNAARGSFRVTSNELWFESFTSGAAAMSHGASQAEWNWDGEIEIGKITYGAHASTDHYYHLRREGNRLWIDEARCVIGDGNVSTVATIEFGTAERQYSGLIWVEDSDLAAWIPSFVADGTGTVGGIASATATWTSSGFNTEDLRRNLRANLNVEVRDGYFYQTAVTQGIAALLGLNELMNVEVYWAKARGRVADESLHLGRVRMQTNRYRGEMKGDVGFDGSLNLEMILNFPIPIARRIPDLTGIENFFPTEVPLAFKLAGTVREPNVIVVRHNLMRPLKAVGEIVKTLGRFFLFQSDDSDDSETRE